MYLFQKYVGKYSLDQSQINDSGKFRVLDRILAEMKEKVRFLIIYQLSSCLIYVRNLHSSVSYLKII